MIMVGIDARVCSVFGRHLHNTTTKMEMFSQAARWLANNVNPMILKYVKIFIFE